MSTRRFLLVSLLAMAALPGTAAAQRRGRRCWYEPRRIRYRDRWGRIRHRTVRQRVCR
ncbi:hypothetical protein [Roseicella aquatilis]|uniref:hypothetical protein n=1 Tax=Roseicella aquatilis TaxID=2527868 RepID=UPI00140520BD|nr:hypothetical protein [Roseicella aquatilis]